MTHFSSSSCSARCSDHGVTAPTSSFLRFTVPLVTLAAPPAVWLRARTATTVALLGGLLLQLWWLQSHLPLPLADIAPP